jgi:hypothetical protein
LERGIGPECWQSIIKNVRTLHARGSSRGSISAVVGISTAFIDAILGAPEFEQIQEYQLHE